MMLKSAVIWGMPREPIMSRVTYFHETTLEGVPEGHLHQCGGSTCRVQTLDGLSNVGRIYAPRLAKARGELAHLLLERLIESV
jgi:hypothetical protein